MCIVNEQDRSNVAPASINEGLQTPDLEEVPEILGRTEVQSRLGNMSNAHDSRLPYDCTEPALNGTPCGVYIEGDGLLQAGISLC